MWSWLQRVLGRRSASTSLGGRGEDISERFLKQLGWKILARDHRNDLGELDFIALDGETVVFVEVKTRRDTQHGRPVEAVNPEKQRRITRAALAYLKRRRWLERRSRFDVLAVVWRVGTTDPEITHYRNAFEAQGHGQMYS
ncbi:MAG: YraN family protein [Planctomycetaceae bacterium]|nr:YraN family protein [Planctomycetaceae bacterium]